VTSASHVLAALCALETVFWLSATYAPAAYAVAAVSSDVSSHVELYSLSGGDGESWPQGEETLSAFVDVEPPSAHQDEWASVQLEKEQPSAPLGGRPIARTFGRGGEKKKTFPREDSPPQKARKRRGGLQHEETPVAALPIFSTCSRCCWSC